MVKYYLSNIVFGLGRFVVITTAEQVENRDIIAETYVFGLDTEGIFKGAFIHYQYHEGDENVTDIDLDFMEQEAMNQAKMIINELRISKYNETKEVEFLKNISIDFQECRKEVIVTLKNRWYREDLEQLLNDTQNLDFKDYLKAILALRVTVSTYENPVR